jgi:hypothetical protein
MESAQEVPGEGLTATNAITLSTKDYTKLNPSKRTNNSFLKL